MAVTEQDVITNAQAIADLINTGSDNKTINELTQELSLANDDEFHFWDKSIGADRKVPVSSFPGTDVNAIHDNQANEISAITEKVTPVGNDLILIEDSAAANIKKKVKVTNLPGGAGAGSVGITFVLRGNSVTGVKQTQILMPASATISKVIIYADTAPTGASLIVDINKNGTTIFTTQSKRPQIAIGTNIDDSDTPDITALVQDDRVSVDVDQVGSTVAGGNDLLITVVFS